MSSKKPIKFLELPYSILIYDIESSLLMCWLFALGEQRVGHSQLVECFDMFGIITISYKWYGKDEVIVLEGENAVEEFDKIARTADVIIGKNNFRFDDKRLNTERLIKGLEPFPEFMRRSDDIESQLRRNFAFPSFSLDALSKFFGEGGKEKMEFNDWVAINKLKLLEQFESRCGALIALIFSNAFTLTLFKQLANVVRKEGTAARKKMGHYNGKDVLDTEALLVRILPYVKWKKNAGADKVTKEKTLFCMTCGSEDLIKTKIVTGGATKYQEFHCLNHDGYAGRATFGYTPTRSVKYGKMS